MDKLNELGGSDPNEGIEGVIEPPTPSDAEKEVIDPELHANMSMPDEPYDPNSELSRPPTDFRSDTDVTPIRQISADEIPLETMGDTDMDLESVPARVEADEADKGENLVALDPRKEFEQKKQQMDMINDRINQVSGTRLETLRRELTILESQELDMYSVKTDNIDSDDFTDNNLEYHKTHCSNIIAKDYLVEIANRFSKIDSDIKSQTSQNKRIGDNLAPIQAKMVNLEQNFDFLIVDFLTYRKNLKSW